LLALLNTRSNNSPTQFFDDPLNVTLQLGTSDGDVVLNNDTMGDQLHQLGIDKLTAGGKLYTYNSDWDELI
jgi:hypothetical protein